jgi:hypothetical protein
MVAAMVRVITTKTGVSLRMDREDTYAWAHREGAAWSCSRLSGKRFRADFDRNGLCDLWVGDGYAGKANGDIPADEFNAIVADHLEGKLPTDHPCYGVTVGQFKTV